MFARGPTRLSACHSIDDLRLLAKRRLPRSIFDFYDGGAEDERTLRESCASVLQMDGYNVTLVGRGEEALDTVKRRKFDIILVDLYMSQISGLDILRAIATE